MSDCDSLIQIFRFSGIRKIDRYSGRRKGPGKEKCVTIPEQYTKKNKAEA